MKKRELQEKLESNEDTKQQLQKLAIRFNMLEVSLDHKKSSIDHLFLGGFCYKTGGEKVGVWKNVLQRTWRGQDEMEAVQWWDYLWFNVISSNFFTLNHNSSGRRGYENEIAKNKKEMEEVMNNRFVIELRDESIQVGISLLSVMKC